MLIKLSKLFIICSHYYNRFHNQRLNGKKLQKGSMKNGIFQIVLVHLMENT